MSELAVVDTLSLCRSGLARESRPIEHIAANNKASSPFFSSYK
jgi:hypothetical protein